MHELNTSLYKKLKNNASVIGKRLANKSAPRGQINLNNSYGLGSGGPGSMIVTHHPLYPRQDSRPDTSIGQVSNHSKDDSTFGFKRGGKEHNHAKLLKSIINPENPFAKMTEKDMLIFNPTYHEYLQKMKNKEAKSSELAQIVRQPYNPKIA